MVVLRSFLSLKLHLLYHYLFATHFQMLPFTERKKQSENISNEKKSTTNTKVIFSQSRLKWRKKRGRHIDVVRQPFALSQSC